jgi:hypothetical protein
VGQRADRIVHLLRRAGEVSFADWRYVAAAAKELLIARIHYGMRPIGSILRDLQTDLVERLEPKATPEELVRFSWALGAAAAQVPWRSDCVLRVMAADRWMRRRGLRPQFYLGAKDTAGRFEAHVWLCFDSIPVTGGSGEDFTALLQPQDAGPRTELKNGQQAS